MVAHWSWRSDCCCDGGPPAHPGRDGRAPTLHWLRIARGERSRKEAVLLCRRLLLAASALGRSAALGQALTRLLLLLLLLLLVWRPGIGRPRRRRGDACPRGLLSAYTHNLSLSFRSPLPALRTHSAVRSSLSRFKQRRRSHALRVSDGRAKGRPPFFPKSSYCRSLILQGPAAHMAKNLNFGPRPVCVEDGRARHLWQKLKKKEERRDPR